MLTLSTLKDWLLAESLRSDYKWDDALTAIGAGVSAAFDRYTNRTLAYTVGAKDIFRGNLEAYVLACYPVVQITSVELRDSVEDGWVSQTVNDVVGQLDESTGLVLMTSRLGESTSMVRVTYTGGYWWYSSTYTTLPTGATAAPEALLYCYRMACEKHWRLRDKIGLTITNPEQPESADPYRIDDRSILGIILQTYMRHQIL